MKYDSYLSLDDKDIVMLAYFGNFPIVKQRDTVALLPLACDYDDNKIASILRFLLREEATLFACYPALNDTPKGTLIGFIDEGELYLVYK